MDAKWANTCSAHQQPYLNLPSGEIATVTQDERLRWPDSFAQGSDGAIYVTASHSMDNMWFNPAAGPATRTAP